LLKVRGSDGFVYVVTFMCYKFVKPGRVLRSFNRCVLYITSYLLSSPVFRFLAGFLRIEIATDILLSLKTAIEVLT